MFPGFPEETVEFLMDLRFHNNVTFFHENHDQYIAMVQKPFYDLISDLGEDMKGIDPFMEIRPYKCLARIHRDTRFTKDKSPYRDHLWFCFRRANEPREGSVNFWFEFGASTFGWGLGFWGENKPAMELLRRRIIADPVSVEAQIRQCDLPGHNMLLEGRLHKRMSVPEEVPTSLVNWYLARDVYVCKGKPDFGIAFSEDLADILRRDFLAMAPLYRLFRGLCDEL